MMVVVAIVWVTMITLFLGRIADSLNGHIKMQCLARQRVISIDGYFLIGDFGHND
jgi:hypothetical protein